MLCRSCVVMICCGWYPECLNKGWSLLEGWGLLCSGSVERQNGLTSQLWHRVKDFTIGILLCLPQVYFTNPSGAVTQEASVAWGSAVCMACECLLERLRKRWAHLCLDSWSRRAFVTAERRLWIHPVPFTNIWKMFVWILEQIPRGKIRHKD